MATMSFVAIVVGTIILSMVIFSIASTSLAATIKEDAWSGDELTKERVALRKELVRTNFKYAQN